jgi:hypothetical protein
MYIILKDKVEQLERRLNKRKKITMKERKKKEEKI